MTLNDKTAVKIKEIRDAKNISQSGFAKQLDMSSSAYGRVENGEVQITLNMLDKISEKLNVPLFELLDFKSTHVNHFNNNQFAQSGGSTINISLTAEEFERLYAQIKKEK